MRLLLFILTTLLIPVTAGAREPVPSVLDGESNELPEGYTHATFDGGDITEFRKWIAENISYPEECLKDSVSGRVVVSFVVDRGGGMRDIDMVSGPDRRLTREVLRVLGQSQYLGWKPGKDPDGYNISIKYTVPVVFRLPGPDCDEQPEIYDGKLLPEGFTHASFDNGTVEDFVSWVHESLRYPPEFCIDGRVISRFVIERSGQVGDIEILISPDKMLSDEVTRLIESSSGKWQPGKDDNSNDISIKYIIIVKFKG